jgi:hypothetical protein
LLNIRVFSCIFLRTGYRLHVPENKLLPFCYATHSGVVWKKNFFAIFRHCLLQGVPGYEQHGYWHVCVWVSRL